MFELDYECNCEVFVCVILMLCGVGDFLYWLYVFVVWIVLVGVVNSFM